MTANVTGCQERPDHYIAERRSYAEFAVSRAEPKYRAALAALYATWQGVNEDHFEGRLVEPHFWIDRTAHRSLGHCEHTTGHGGRIQVVLNHGLVFGTKREWVVRPWRPDLPRDPDLRPQGEGTKAFIDDFVLRFTVRQYVLEVLKAEERGYRGFGPLFAEEATRAGSRLGLGKVVVCHRNGVDEMSPLARGWPHCVRPATRYQNDVTEHALALACGLPHAMRQATAVPTEGLLELIDSRLAGGRVEEVRAMIARHLEWVRRYQELRPVPRRRAELGKEDVDGTVLGEVTLDRAWLDWNDGTVRRIAQGIYESGSFWDLPILADALTDAGCTDDRILRHLYHPMEHSRRCWVLRLLLVLDAE